MMNQMGKMTTIATVKLTEERRASVYLDALTNRYIIIILNSHHELAFSEHYENKSEAIAKFDEIKEKHGLKTQN